jgi:class 3 adenylate cyclase
VGTPPVHYAKTVDGLHIAYQTAGEGPFDLVYAPGWISNLECIWEMPDLGDFLRHLAGFSRLIVLDRRGSGLSDRPFTIESLSLEAGMDDIRAVMDAAGSERAALFGFEDGGGLGCLFAASYPDRVSALVLFAVFAKYLATPDYPGGWTDEQSREWLERIEQHWGSEEFWRSGNSYLSSRLEQDPERLRAWARYTRLAASPGTVLAIERAGFEIDLRPVLPALQVPTLVMSRSDDRFFDIRGSRYVAGQIPGAKLVELPGDEHAPFLGDSDAVLGETQRFLSAIRAEEAEFDRVLATVLFTDIVGSTERATAIGDRAWRDLAAQHHTTVRALIARYRGTEVDTAGDGFFATFDGPARAVRCAQAIVEAVRPLGIEIRAGVHTGEVERVGDEVSGIAVNIGARVGALAGPSEILASSTVRDLTAGSGLQFEEAGEHELKGISERWRLYRVTSPGDITR